jgi:hypothetical protein
MESGLKGKVYRLAALVAESVGQRRWRLRAKEPSWRSSVQIYHLSKWYSCAPTGREDFA